MAAGIWRSVAQYSNLAQDLQLIASLQHIARCSQLWSSNSPVTQQQRQLCSSTSSSSAASATSAAPSAQTPSAAASASSSGNSSSQAARDSQGFLPTLITGRHSKELGPQDIGLFYEFNKSLVPEAFKPFHQAFYSPRPAKLQRKGGCRSLQAVFSCTGSNSLMWRRSSQELAAVLESSAVSAVHLKGPTGTGKSIAVVQAVEWARSNGWFALYIPAAMELTRGGFFYPRADGTYDTIISAQHILKSVSDSHDKQLMQHKLQLQESKDLLQSPAAAAAIGAGAGAVSNERDTLRDLVQTGLSTDDNGKLAVECCLQLVKEFTALSAEVPVLLAVDGYNSLYWHTEYGRTIHRTPEGKPAYQFRVKVPVQKLNLARNFRLLQRKDLQQCRVLVADSSSSGVPDDVSVPVGKAAVYNMPRFSEVETAHMLYYYHERGLVAAPPTEQQVAAMRALTVGSGEELRRWSVKITQTDMGLL